ncbi:phosphate/phosphite/phosphonate ABC transporter substrate-binding protein [Paraburkholderia rhizosphaerae]|uniref:ABC-type phosphate/phosphonate transport system substrate-binding protein n=1 Tax=Paraburkholderia rhizosphaerae TaxID=480658 RepID=A0A4R8LZD4_9BURK|nr:PhnD/SsuA/transferrin family substrate-binding protein [Paraburkholderia rhizosphaerae]TDY52219.1 ABC-type phosphate/phosphonate transport system substrate-binding protein [Paraburkholderia rhizosphaerae]
MDLVAVFPMYNVSPELADAWRELAREVGERVAVRGQRIKLDIASTEPTQLDAIWRRPDLLLSQTCGYPLTHGLAEHVHVVGVPIFDAPGCHEYFYSSAIVVRRTDRASALDDYRGKIVAYNDDSSHSGMNALRHAVAPLARGGRFFSQSVRTGSHLDSLRAVSGNRADIASIDCVTLAFAGDYMPDLIGSVRVLALTRAAPALPFIASRSVERDMLSRLAPAVGDVIAARPLLAERLRLKGLAMPPDNAFQAILEREDEARRAGYPNLA